MDDWYWAVRREGPAGDAFVIENGKTALLQRVRAEIDHDEQCAWMPIHKGAPKPDISHVLDMLLRVVPLYRVNQNRFVLEAAKIPAFAKFLREAPYSLPSYVSNSAYPDALIPIEPYTPAAVERLGNAVSRTLEISGGWYWD